MAKPGIEAVHRALPKIITDLNPDLVIAQAENVTDGKGMSIADMKALQKLGVDFFTGGNHTPKQPELNSCLTDPNQLVIGPANMMDCPGAGWKYAKTKAGPVLVICLLGKIVGKEADKPTHNPLKTIDAILEQNKTKSRVATVVDFHGAYSS